MKHYNCFNRLYVSFTGENKISRFIILAILFIIWSSVIDADASWLYWDPVLPPVAICKNISVQLGPGGNITISGSDVDGGSYDPDGTITSLTVSPNIFNCSQTGPNTVILTVTDNEGLSSTCSATVTVEDKIPPVMTCRDYTLYLNAAGTGTLTTTDINNGSTDNCSTALFMYLSRTNFNCSDLGAPVPVMLIGTDASGNSASCTSLVTVVDNVAPVINLKPFNLVLGSSGTATLLPADIDNGTYDICGSVTLSVTPDSFSCSDLGQKTVILTATDSHGNSSSQNVTVNISSTLQITGMSLSSCDLSPTLALFETNAEGGNGDYSYFWRGLNPGSRPFMVIIPFPPSLQFYNTSALESPFFNITMPNGYYDVRLVISDGNGCADSTEITINKTGPVSNNQTFRLSEACEGEIETYSVNYKADATYSWTAVNGTILNSNPDTSKISVRWNLGAVQGIITTTILEPNELFPGDQCESTVIDTVTISTFPVPVFNSFTANACSNLANTYSLTNIFAFQNWTVTGGVITAGGKISDNFVTILWGSGPTGTVSVSVGNISTCLGSAAINVSISNIKGSITSLTDISCNGGTDGSVTVAADPGTGLAPYMYSLDGGIWQASGTFSGISLGNHTVTVRDALLCTFDLQFIINQPLPVSGSISAQVNVSCFLGNDGSVTIAASGGMAPYQFRLNAGPLQSLNIFSGLSAGSYLVTIQDSHGCTESVPFTITQPPVALNGSASVTDVTCFGESTGRIDLTVTGGTPPYSYLWNNGAAVEDIANLAAGNYSVVITDAGGCITIVNATVSQPASALSATASVTNVLCFGGTTGAVDITVAGGISPYSFVWNNGATTEDLINLSAGSYSIIITDSNGCIFSLAVSVTQPPSSVGGSVIARNNVTCFGGNNGNLTVSGSGGIGPWEYQLNAGPFQSSGNFGSLTAGTYNIIIRDANMCIFVLPVTITEPSTPLGGNIVSQTDVLCFNEASGTITVSGSGGTSPYEYGIDGGPFQSSGIFTGLNAGLHTITIRDSNLCTFSLPATLGQPVSLPGGSIISQTTVKCYGETTGSVTVLGSGGTPPYTYSINGGSFQISGLLENLGAGTYNVTVRDFNLCQFVMQVIIDQPASPFTVAISSTNVLCMGGTSGTATALPSGGTAPYTFLWNTVPPQTVAMATNLSAGIYSVTVTDNNGCVSSGVATISQPSIALTATLAVTDVSCNSDSDGSINLTVSNGTLPMTFLWSNGAVTEDLSGIAAGTYSVSVTDANGCTANGSATINQPAVLSGTIIVTNVLCFGENTGSCDLTVTGGTSPYTYLWSTGSVTKDISALTAGNYSVTITDSHGCTTVVNASVAQPVSALTGSITSQTNVSVYGGNDGSVTVSGTGGTAPYQYRLDGGSYQASGTFGTLTAGSFTVTVQDAGLCTFDVLITITQPWIALTANIISQTNILCFGGTTGSVTVTGWGGTSPYLYSLNGGTFGNSGTFSSLSAGLDTITVRDAAMDVFDIIITITEPDELDVAVSGEDVHCYGAATGNVTASVLGGTAPYSFLWDTTPAQTTATATGLAAGTYEVTVTDANGCIATNNVTILQPAMDMNISITSLNVLCSGGETGSSTAQVEGGLAPFTFSWNTIPEQTKESATDLSAGNYTVTVTDSYGCVKTGSVTITEPQEILVVASINPSSCPDSDDGAINLTITGGQSPYNVIWSDGINTQNRTQLKAGEYSVIVTDHNACAKSFVLKVDFTWTFNCLVIPQVITPNNDGYNDEWIIRNIDLYPNAEVHVYNRWGKMVFSTKNLSENPWDGRIDGKLAPTDSYHYILYLNDGSEPRSGVISIIR